eukprot:TRINITY_DN79115_c0_g1_i1.p1 TRINITY_DN79115_c0_g1~~TRINITY_DN79115_c0_g1_i1.p1  ORF type:complete len:315 (-),score=37.38 TRINITY_DN79115_c0_g1_i1:389-1261(-)
MSAFRSLVCRTTARKSLHSFAGFGCGPCQLSAQSPSLPDDSRYKPKGEMIKIGGSDCYSVGDNWGTAVVVFHDVFGPASGGHKQVCDKLADCGHYVIMPDFFEGGSIEPYYKAQKVADGKQWLKKYSWNYCSPIMDSVYSHLYDDLKVTKCGSIGFCWGAWAVAKACQDPSKMHAGVWAHPSCQVGHELYGEGDEKELASLVRSPTLIISTPQEADMYKDGTLTKTMGENGVVTDSIHMPSPVTHGFFVRAAGFLGKSWKENGGQLDQQEFVAVNRGINLSLGWYAKHLF